MHRLNIVFLVTVSIVTLTTNAQTSARVIKGVVTDGSSSAPLEGVTILAKGSQLLSESQTDGIYAIPITEKDSILIFRFEDYAPREVRVLNDNELNIQLLKGGISDNTPSFSQLSGIWRGVFEIKQGIETPFQFILQENGSQLQAFLINGEEKFPAGQVSIKNDSIFIGLPLFENELALSFQNNQLKGSLRKQDGTGFQIPIKAERGLSNRFTGNGSSALKDMSGRYDVVFKSSNGKEEKAVGVFKQTGTKVYATFLRVTGDSRYLEGIIEDNHIRLSSFIGSTPSLYLAEVDADGVIKGESVSARGGLPFTANLNSNAALPDAYTLTTLKEGKDHLEFNFPDAEGKLVNISDKRFEGKALIISIGGTWCPNCMDEAAFLGNWYEKNKQRGIEIIGLQYERQTDPAYVKKAFDRFKKQFNINYPLLLGGVADKQVVVNSLPAMQNFLSFPTTIFVDKTGKVTKIHTGFSGPATGEAYNDFIKEFNAEVDQLLSK